MFLHYKLMECVVEKSFKDYTISAGGVILYELLARVFKRVQTVLALTLTVTLNLTLTLTLTPP